MKIEELVKTLQKLGASPSFDQYIKCVQSADLDYIFSGSGIRSILEKNK
jgi:hypothetical protein